MIDFEIIKKLIKLANNNPNDNEANSAARKVCKLLAEYEFPVQQQSSNINSQQIFQDIQRNANTPPWKSTPPFAGNIIICPRCNRIFIAPPFGNYSCPQCGNLFS